MPTYYAALLDDRGIEPNALFGLTRQAVTFPAGGGTVASSSQVDFPAIPTTPVFAAPNDHPNVVYIQYLALCSGAVAGVNDILGRVEQGTDGLGRVVQGSGATGVVVLLGVTDILGGGDFLRYAVGAITFDAATGAVTATPTALPTRGFGTGSPCSDACWKRRFYATHMHDFSEWIILRYPSSITPNPFIADPIEIAAWRDAVSEGTADWHTQTAGCGCP